MSTFSEEGEEPPRLASDTSRGSSVSADLQEEYDELLKYAIVTPKWNPGAMVTATDTLPQLRLSGPDQKPLTTIEEYSATSSTTQRTEEDSAVGSEEPETARKLVEPSWHLTDPEDHTPRPIPSPGQTPYRGPMLSPTPSSGSRQSERTPEQIPISSYLSKNDGVAASAQKSGKDEDMERMNNQLDQWYGKLKTMVLAELSQTKIAMGEDHRREIHKLKQEHQTEIDKLQDEISQLKELLHTYEVSVGRKDQVISNLTRAVQTGQDRLEMARRMMQWKLRMIDEKRQSFTTHLARKHRERALAMKAWHAWRCTIEAKWKERVEKACQKKAQEVCEQLTDDYEKKIAELNEALQNSRDEVVNLHQQREKYEETMKKAFMRGVCALNLEAMSMFQDDNERVPNEVRTLSAAIDALSCASDCNPPHVSFKEPDSTAHGPYSMSSATVDYSRPVPTTRPKSGGTGNKSAVVTGKVLSNPPVKSTGDKVQVNRSQTLSAKVTTSGKGTRHSRCARYPPPPYNVLVERHHPNVQNYQTEQQLSHVAKCPFSPTKNITPQQLPLPCATVLGQMKSSKS